MNDDEVLAAHAREADLRQHRRGETVLVNGRRVAMSPRGHSPHRLARMLAFAGAQRAKGATKKSKRKAANTSKRRNRGT